MTVRPFNPIVFCFSLYGFKPIYFYCQVGIFVYHNTCNTALIMIWFIAHLYRTTISVEALCESNIMGVSAGPALQISLERTHQENPTPGHKAQLCSRTMGRQVFIFTLNFYSSFIFSNSFSLTSCRNPATILQTLKPSRPCCPHTPQQQLKP